MLDNNCFGPPSDRRVDSPTGQKKTGISRTGAPSAVTLPDIRPARSETVIPYLRIRSRFEENIEPVGVWIDLGTTRAEALIDDGLDELAWTRAPFSSQRPGASMVLGVSISRSTSTSDRSCRRPLTFTGMFSRALEFGWRVMSSTRGSAVS